MTATNVVLDAAAKTPLSTGYNRPIGYLRAFIVAMVVAHHAALAYKPVGLLPPVSLAAQSRWWEAFPVLDSRKWSGFSFFVDFNDIFFMSLMSVI